MISTDRKRPEELQKKTVVDLPQTGFVRLLTILELIPVSKSAWWAGIKEGRFPRGIKLGLRTTAWRAEDIRSLIEDPSQRFDRKASA